ncbi:MAG TPA: hypothetical protein ENG52_04000, partial [Nitrososphaeria archaeon]|nr:hypothetical protein [Nitrososphaeria archaeon]
MDWVQVGLGILAGIVYSLVGWLRNKLRYEDEVPDPEKVADSIIHLREEPKKAKLMAEAIVMDLLEEAWEIKAKFNLREFLTTVAQGLVIGIFMGGLGLPLDVSVSLAT